MASHSPIDHIVSKPCIFFWKVRQRETIPVIVIESIHHALQNLDEDLDEAWEDFHGTYPSLKRLFSLRWHEPPG
jgi:hypothetical protein